MTGLAAFAAKSIDAGLPAAGPSIAAPGEFFAVSVGLIQSRRRAIGCLSMELNVRKLPVESLALLRKGRV